MISNISASCQVVGTIGTGVSQVADLALVAIGLKPASILYIYSWNMAPDIVEAKLQEARLSFKRFSPSRCPNTCAEYAVARDNETVELMLSARTDREFGMLYGYPETAIMAFESGQKYTGEIPYDVRRSMFRFSFSPGHFREEFLLIRRWHIALAEYAPEIVSRHIANIMS